MVKLLTIKEAVERTKLSPGWWRQRIFRKDLCFMKIGKRVFIPEQTVEELLRNGMVQARKDSPYLRRQIEHGESLD